MNRIFNKRQALCRTVWLIVACAALALWPLRLIREEIRSVSGDRQKVLSETVDGGYVVQQRFIAQYDRLKEIEIYLAEWGRGDQFNFVLRDGAMQPLMQQIINVREMGKIPGYCRIQINIDTEVGRDYYFQLQGVESEFRVAYVDNTTDTNIYMSTLYYGDTEDVERCLMADYVYETPLRKGKTLAAFGALLLFGALATVLAGRYYSRFPERNRLVTVEWAMRVVCNPLILAAALLAACSIWPLKLFTNDVYSILFYEAGVFLAAVAAFYAVNHSRTGLATSRSLFDLAGERWRDDLQAAMYAGALWGCCNYMNALYEIHHTVAYRQTLIFLALSLIVTWSRRELLNLVNVVYAVVAAFAGPLYYKDALADLTEASLTAGKEGPGELDILALKLTVWAAVVSGLVILNTVKLFWKRQPRGISFGYGALVGGFFALLLLRRNLRGWPIFLVCVFSLIYLRMAASLKKERLIHNIVNGILLHFVLTMGYCLLHRPYMYFRYYRYPFHFHTVTISAVYLALVVCAALVKFLDAYGRNQRLAGIYKELFLFGASSMYLLFTLSRTGYLSVLAMALVVIPLAFFAQKELSFRERRQRFLGGLGVMAAALLVCFPIVFTAQRMIPAVAADLKAHEIEDFPTELVHGRNMDSYYYITVERFIQAFQMKVLGMPEEECLDAFLFFSKREGAAEYRSPYLEEGRRILLASAEDMAAAPEEEMPYTNGRMYIFKQYYDRLNQAGHDDMGIMEPDGNYLVHAHNIYLQVAYDHGIPVGIAFLLLGLGTLLAAARYFFKHREDRACALFPFALLILFAVAGLTEWIFHPCVPIACSLLLAMGPLLVDMRA